MQAPRTPIDFNSIEAEARRLRAEAIRTQFAALRNFIGGLFAPKGHGANA
ncbi:MAG: hypothetical protein HRT60_10670 [Dinoroseobacter sp.]|nr:hypothetical protein [Dinoroseobacter sp.]NQZ73524.1 hypothetical protein [Dinoroseobacter sp.]